MGIVDRIRTAKHLRTLRSAGTASPESVREAKHGLLEIGDSALEGLIELLPVKEAQEAVSEVLEALLSDRLLPRFLDALASPDRSVQREITSILARGRGYDPSGLIPALTQPEVPNQRLESILKARTDISPEILVDILPDLAREARTIVARLLEDRVEPAIGPRLARLADHSDWWIRHHMAKLLGRIPDEVSEEALIRLVADSSKSVRLEAVKSLQALAAKSAVATLARALRDPDLTVQAAAIDALVTLGDPGAVPHLVDVLQDESEQARRAAVEVLNEVATEEAVQDLVTALRDADWWVRVRAADALGTLGGKPVVDAILGLMKDDDVHLRRYAVEILNTVPDGRSVDPLIEALNDDDWWVRERSIDALGRSGEERAVEPLVDHLAIDGQASPLCARALGQLGFVSALEPLMAVVGASPAEEPHREALAALNLLAKGDVPPSLQERLDRTLREQGVRVEQTKLRPMAIRAGAAAADLGPETGANQSPAPPGRAPGSAWKLSTEEAAPPAPAPAKPRSETPEPEPIAAGTEATGGIQAHRLRAEDIHPGMKLLDRYQVLEKIGRGGFATVFLAADQVISEDVILKILSPHLSADERMHQRFVQELRIARRISHPNVIRIHDLLEIGEAKAISMEYFVGRDLGKVLDKDKSLPSDRALRISYQVAEGLAAAHDAGVIHRDVKPGNILVGDDDEVKLLDFGLASATHDVDQRLTKTGHLVGTPHYMAPELIRGEDVDGRADLYSFGVVMYEMISGSVPFDGDNPMNILFRHLDGDATPIQEIVPDLPEGVVRLVERTMALDPNDRPDDARALAAEILEVDG